MIAFVVLCVLGAIGVWFYRRMYATPQTTVVVAAEPTEPIVYVEERIIEKVVVQEVPVAVPVPVPVHQVVYTQQQPPPQPVQQVVYTQPNLTYGQHVQNFQGPPVQTTQNAYGPPAQAMYSNPGYHPGYPAHMTH